MNSLGKTLRRERESQHRTLAEISESLCITQRYLSAIENDDLQSLPGTFFYKSFVKQYAALLGVPESRIQGGMEELSNPVEELPLPGQDPRYTAPQFGARISWFKSRFWAPDEAPRDPQTAGGEGLRTSPGRAIRALDPLVEAGNRYFSDRRIGVSLAGLVAVLLVCSGFYAWWNRAPQPATQVAQGSASVVRTVATNSGGGDPSQTIQVTESQESDGHAVLNISATEKTWISVTANGKPVFTGVLEPSETKVLTGLQAAQMKVGNAAGLDVRWHGKPIGPIGPRGQVRTVVLTPENYEIISPKPPPPDDDPL